MAEEAHSAYAQLLSVGLLWISVHCAGMCGPLLIGFDVAGAAKGVPAWRGGLAILTYQGGRALVYALLGALAGLFGAGLEQTLTHAGAVFALTFGAFALAGAMWRYVPKRAAPLSIERRGAPGATAGDAPPEPDAGVLGGVVARFRRFILPLAGGRSALNHLTLGALMGLLPCMITYWVLGLAATTRSPLHGAGLMILLVVMTTPMLLGVTLLPRLFVGRLGRLGRHVPAALMTLSGVWLTMVGLAGLEVVEHLHVNFALFGEPFTMMLW